MRGELAALYQDHHVTQQALCPLLVESTQDFTAVVGERDPNGAVHTAGHLPRQDLLPGAEARGPGPGGSGGGGLPSP